MRFLISVIDTGTNTADSDEMSNINAFNDNLQDAGHWIFACGIAAPDTAVTIDNRAGAALEWERPFVSTEEYQSGFWLIEADDLETAKRLAHGGSLACNRKVEVRALL